MAFTLFVLLAAVAAANAGYLGGYGAPAVAYGAVPSYGYGSNLAYGGAVGASHQSTLRSLDGNHVVSQYSKNVDTPFSSVRKVDTRVSNDAVAVAHTYAAPALAAYHAPAVAAYAAPALAHTYAAPALAHTYAAPVATAVHGAAYAAPYAASYAAPYAASYAAPYAASYAAPYASTYHGGAVSHISFDGIGAHYAY